MVNKVNQAIRSIGSAATSVTTLLRNVAAQPARSPGVSSDELTPLLANQRTAQPASRPPRQALQNQVGTTYKHGLVPADDDSGKQFLQMEQRHDFKDGSKLVDLRRAEAKPGVQLLGKNGQVLFQGKTYDHATRYMKGSLTEPHTDAHFHPSNYVQRTMSILTMVSRMARVGARFSTAMPIPTSQLDLVADAELKRTGRSTAEMTLPGGVEVVAIDARGIAAALNGESSTAAQHTGHHHCEPRLEHYYVSAATVKGVLDGVNAERSAKGEPPKSEPSTEDWLAAMKKDPKLIDRIAAQSDLYVYASCNQELAHELGTPEKRAATFEAVAGELQSLKKSGLGRADVDTLGKLVEQVRTQGLSDEAIAQVTTTLAGIASKPGLDDRQRAHLDVVKDHLLHSGLTDAQRARIDPMITGLHIGDLRVGDYLLKALSMNPKTFTGIGEITVHKELVELMFAGQRGQANTQKRLEPLTKLLEMAGVFHMPVTLHCDIDNLQEQVKDAVTGRTGRPPANFEGLKEMLQDPRVANTKVIQAHAGGLGRFVQETDGHLGRVQSLLDTCPNFMLDISWSEVAKQLTKSPAKMAQWTDFIEKNSDRILFGSDSLAPQTDEKWAETMKMYDQLFAKLTPQAKEKVLNTNYENTFVAARAKVRHVEEMVLTPKFVAEHVNNAMGADGLPAQPVTVETIKQQLAEGERLAARLAGNESAAASELAQQAHTA
jgi:hypothetical protein